MEEIGIEDLSLEVLTHILSFLSFRQRQRASEVCKRWFMAAQQPRFLNKTSIYIDAEMDDWDTLQAIEKRRIPNLIIHFEDGKSVSPEIAHHVELASHVTNLHLGALPTAAVMVFCLRHFSNLKFLQVDCILDPKEFLGRVEAKMCSALMTKLDNLDFHVSYIEDTSATAPLITLITCLTRAKNLSLTFEPSDSDIEENSESPMNGTLLNDIFAKTNLAQNLRELDITSFYVDHKSFSDFVKTPNLRLRSLAFQSLDGNGRNLSCLADSDFDLESVTIGCKDHESYDVRYPMIQNLISKKPSLKHLRCSNVKYPCRTNCQVAGVMKDWGNIASVNIDCTFCAFDGDPTVNFVMQDRTNMLIVEVAASLYGSVIQGLAKRSSGLRKLMIFKETVDNSGVNWLPVLADSFSELTELTLECCNFAKVSLSVLGISQDGKGGSKLTKLRVLHISNCSGLSDEDFQGLHFPVLRWLLLTGSKHIGDGAVSLVVASNPSLQLLGLARCKIITDVGVKAIAQHLKHLRCLVLSDCTAITAGATKHLKNCQMLELVDASRCDEALIDSLKALRKTLPYFRKVVTDKYEFQFDDEWKWAL